MKIKRDWHPIFKFLFELFKDLPPHFKCFYNSKLEVEIIIQSYLEDTGMINIFFEKKVKLEDQDKVKPGELLDIREEWQLSFSDGSCSCIQEIEFKSFTENAIKTAKSKSRPYLPKEYNDEHWTWIKKQLDFVLKAIKESHRINPYTGKALTDGEAREFDKKMSGRIAKVEDFGEEVGEALSNFRKIKKR